MSMRRVSSERAEGERERRREGEKGRRKYKGLGSASSGNGEVGYEKERGEEIFPPSLLRFPSTLQACISRKPSPAARTYPQGTETSGTSTMSGTPSAGRGSLTWCFFVALNKFRGCWESSPINK